VGRAIAAFEACGAEVSAVLPGSASGPYPCAVVVDRADGSQVMIPSPVPDTSLSLSPDGTWLVYLHRDATIVRNLLTGTVHRVTRYLTPTAWSPNNRWLLAAPQGYGGDFVVVDTTGAQQVHQHPPAPPSASSAPFEPVPTGPYYPGAVTDRGEVVRYPARTPRPRRPASRSTSSTRPPWRCDARSPLDSIPPPDP
jgi:hypothetical protein